MPPKRLLIFGGTSLAREVANTLHGHGVSVLTSYAGVTHAPHLPSGETRFGGFGGIKGLVQFLKVNPFDVVVDALHPFAAQMSRHAAVACQTLNVPLLRLEPPAWAAQSRDKWTLVPDVSAAVDAVPEGARVAVTVGRKEIASFFSRADLSGVARMIEPPPVAPPSQWHLELERPPFSFTHEKALIETYKLELLVSKNAGGPRAAKLDAAAELSLPVIMIERPAKPKVTTVTTVEELCSVLRV